MNSFKLKKVAVVKSFLLVAFISILTTQSLTFITQKITLENSFRDKLYSEIGRLIDKSKFVVVVNVELTNNPIQMETPLDHNSKKLKKKG